MKTIGGLIAIALAMALVMIAPFGPTASGQDDGKKLVLNIGMPQGIDNMNPVRGVTVAAFEAWNMQYATLTDKSAEDFSDHPRPRRLVEGLRGRQAVDVHAQAGPEVVRRRAPHRGGRGVHDQPLARGGLAQPHGGDRQPHRQGDVADHARGDLQGRRPEAADPRRLHRPEAHLREVRRQADHQVQRPDRRRLRPVHARRVQEGPVRPLRAQPQLLRREARDRRGRDPRLQQRRRDGGRTQQR